MRRIPALLLLPLLTLPAWAKDVPKAAAQQPTHLTWQQRFAQANIAHDGHLTREEANGGYNVVAKHFDDIDAAHKGYVTENDIRAWRVMRRTARGLARPSGGEALTPLPAVQRGPVTHRPINANASGVQATSIADTSIADTSIAGTSIAGTSIASRRDQ